MSDSGHLRLSTRPSLADGLPLIADSRRPGLVARQLDPNFRTTRAAGGTEGPCQ